MPPRKKHGYNWRARQRQPKSTRRGSERDVQPGSSSVYLEEDMELYTPSGDTTTTAGAGDDSNALVLPAKRKKADQEEPTEPAKRKKLSSAQRKRLQKVLEAKEKKAKHSSLLQSLSTLALPRTQMELLLPSVAINRGQKSRQQILLDAKRKHCLQSEAQSDIATSKSADTVGDTNTQEATLVGTSWRKRKRKRRQLKAEKVIFDPKPATEGQLACGASQDEGCESEDESDCDESLPTPTAAHWQSQLQLDGGGSTSVEALSESEGKEDSMLSACSSQSHQVQTASTQLGGNCQPPQRDQVADGGEGLTVAQQGEYRSHSNQGCTTDSVTRQPSVVTRQPARYVQLERDSEIQAARLSLPILGEEQVVMEAITDHPVVVLCGETGSGKTTQVPQFLYEAGYTSRGEGGKKSLIGITEPRRVAAVSMSKRVAKEMALSERQVSYQIRYEGNTTDNTVVKFMTDGVLLKEIERDFLLSRYSVVILDEAHERSVFTDILIGLLSRIIPQREKNGAPLKLVIMSATLRVEDFTDNQILFPSPPPVIKIDSRQYPVTVHFNKRTPVDYVAQAYQKVCRIHRTLPGGGILVFVTGQAEVHRLCKRLRQTFPCSINSTGSAGGRRVGVVDQRVGGVAQKQQGEVDLDDYPVLPPQHLDMEDEEGWNLDDQDSEEEADEIEAAFEGATAALDSQLPMIVLPLYSLLPAKQQEKVFQPAPEGVRVCVVATNVAETSLTIPGVKYVVDTGKVKTRFYDKATGVSAFRVVWTSKASCDQRAGRAGRTEPGHCYRLFSSAVFHNEFDKFSPPEITKRPVDDLVLQMKAMNISKVVNFPFPSPPSPEALKAAERLLTKLGAVQQLQVSSRLAAAIPISTITPLGRTMAQFPVAPRYAKMLVLGRQHGCLPFVIAMVAALSVREIFVESSFGNDEAEEERRKRRNHLESAHRAWSGVGESRLLGDPMMLLRAVGACEYAGCSVEFCCKNGLRHKAMVEVRKLRQQLTNAVNVVCPEAGACVDPRMSPPTEQQAKYMRQIVLSGLGDHVARKISTAGMNTDDKKRLRYAYQCTLCEDPVYLHSSSALYHMCPAYVVFQEIRETSKLFMRGVTAVEESWLPVLQPEYCSFSSPLDLPPPLFDDVTGTVRCHMTCTYGDHCWPIATQYLLYPDNLDKYRLFAQFLMQGKVIPALSVFSPYLLVAPITLLKKWSKLHKPCEVLLNALVNREICSRESLLEAWREDPKCLLKAYSMWLPESKHKELAALWPPTT